MGRDADDGIADYPALFGQLDDLKFPALAARADKARRKGNKAAAPATTGLETITLGNFSPVS